MVDFLGFRLALPPPLDSPAGDFLLLMSLWIVLAAVAALAMDRIARRIAGRTRTDLDDKLIKVSYAPLVALIVLYGFQSTLAFVATYSVASPVEGLAAAVDWTVKIAQLGIVVVALVWIYRIADRILIHYAHRWARQTESNVDDVLIPVGEKALLAGMFFVGFTMVLGTFGIDITMLLAGAGLIGLVVAFAAQDTLSNFFSGIFLLLDRPFKEGDWITLRDGRVVQVRRIGLRSSRFYHKFDHTLITIPNRVIAEDEITDLMEPDNRYRQNVQVGVQYGSDLERVTETMRDAIEAHPNVLTEPEDLRPSILFTEHGDSALIFRALFWVDHVENRWKAKDEVTRRINAAFREAGITVPFPQRDLWFKDRPDADWSEAPRPS